MTHDAIAVVDFGGQYAHLIATKIRKAKVFAEIVDPEAPLEVFRKFKGIVLSGSPALSSKGEASDYNHEIFGLDVPILGICFGHQEIAKHYGGKVVHGGREWGYAIFRRLVEHPLFDGWEAEEQVFMSHFDSVVEVGEGFVEAGRSRAGEGVDEQRFSAVINDKVRRYGVQFHPEVDDTVKGDILLANFAIKICGCKPTWTIENFLEAKIQETREFVKDGSVFLLVSGGVDSTVTALIVARALGGDKLHLLHIDNGLMRKDESKAVLRQLEALGLQKNLHFVDAGDEFLKGLEGVFDPEQKRRVIGDTFVEVFKREAQRFLSQECFLAQGTIYPDTIETGGTKRADTIKTHHNRVPLIRKMIEEGRVVEPLKELYKSEVRELGALLGLPKEVLARHPFPGPGLGVRCLCARGDERADEEVASRFLGVCKKYGWEGFVLPIKSVGVKADLRSYEFAGVLWGGRYEELDEGVVSAILKEVEGINRCAYLLHPEKPLEVVVRRAYVTKERLDMLREADSIVDEVLRKHGIYDQIWQCPVVALPLSLGLGGLETIVIRPVQSSRGMTARAYRFPEPVLHDLKSRLSSLPFVSAALVDLTSKPPGTIEWE
jgi:GMP synthase (glutamine-hydrolysing)